MKNFFIVLPFFLMCFFLHCQEDDCAFEHLENELKELDFDTAVHRTLNRSLNLNIASDDVFSKRSLIKQAKLIPNPDFSYEVENFGGINDWRGWNHREERYIWSQLYEMGGKRYFRVKAASYQYYATLVGYDVSKLVLLNNLSKAFINVLAAQELLKVAKDQSVIAKEILNIATKKVEAGKVSLIQQNKAEVAYSNALVALEKAEVELNNSKRRLALLWASTNPDFKEVVFPFFEIEQPINFDQCLSQLCDQPEIVQSLYQSLNAHQIWKLEKANAIPDVTLRVGYKNDLREGNHGLIAGISFPIPIFNRNQGNIGRAYFDMLKTEDQQKLLWLILESKLAISYEELIRAFKEAERIQKVSLPSASQAFRLAEKGYRVGKFEYLDVLDAQRTLFEEKQRYIQALVNYHNRRSDIDYLNSQTN